MNPPLAGCPQLSSRRPVTPPAGLDSWQALTAKLRERGIGVVIAAGPHLRTGRSNLEMMRVAMPERATDVESTLPAFFEEAIGGCQVAGASCPSIALGMGLGRPRYAGESPDQVGPRAEGFCLSPATSAPHPR